MKKILKNKKNLITIKKLFKIIKNIIFLIIYFIIKRNIFIYQLIPNKYYFNFK